jgi:uncharacterized protein YaaW (UPF0174 family)
MDHTLKVLKWAKEMSNETEIVKMFWDELVTKLGLNKSATAEEILDEIRLFGGNTFVNFFRGEGVPYREVAYDVAKSLKKFYETKEFNGHDLETIEYYVLKKMEIQNEDINEICNYILDASNQNVFQNAAANAAQKAVVEGVGLAVGQQLAKTTAQRAAQKAAQKAAEEMGKQVAKQVLVRAISALNVFLALWTVVDIAGPAMRKTIPCVTYIALLRQLYKNYQSGLGEETH